MTAKRERKNLKLAVADGAILRASEKAASPFQVLLHEVGPRDGLQHEAAFVPTLQKLALIEKLVAAGLRRVEVTAFVSPKWAPQLSDGEEVASDVLSTPGVDYSALVPNEFGYERMRGTQVALPTIFVSASETQNRKLFQRSIDAVIDDYAGIVTRAKIERYRLRAYVSMVCGCPDEGAVSIGAVVRVVERLRRLGVDEVSLADTLGVGNPRQIQALVKAVSDVIPIDSLALHLHDTYGRALANLQAGYEAGIRIFDTAIGGLGSCPYAPGAAGNLATEDVVDLFLREGVATGIQLDALLDVVEWLEAEVLQRSFDGHLYRALRKSRLVPQAKREA